MVRRLAASHRTSTPWRWAWCGAACGLLLGLVVFAPARWLAWGVERGRAQHVLLREARGSIWSGSAQLVLAGGADSRDAAALPGRLQWQIRPAWLGLRVALQASCCMTQAWRLLAEPRWTGAAVQLTDGQSRWPASVLSGLGAPWNSIQPEGMLVLSTQGLVVEWLSGRLLMRGLLQLEATDVSSRLSTLRPMGSYRLTLAGGADAGPSLRLETVTGSLSLTGNGQWVGSRLRFDGEATAAPDRVDALSNFLNIIGRRNGLRSINKVG